MDRKRLLISAVAVAVLFGLAYLQYREWRHFNWHYFYAEVKNVSPWRIGFGILVVYVTYFLRALRWKLFLRPVKSTTLARMIAPQFIGFTGLAILGRPGELIRPYLIAKKEKLTFSSQLAVWAVERIFDLGSFAALFAVNLTFSTSLRGIRYYDRIQRGGFLLLGLVVILAVTMVAIRFWGGPIASWLEARRWPFKERIGSGLADKIRSFKEGLNTIHDLTTFLKILLVSLGMWMLVAFAYLQVTHAFPLLRHFKIAHVLLLMGFSIAGSILQLPVVGGGSQLATITALTNVFEGVSPELAACCGILLWLSTFMSVTPAGLFLAHREHVSLRELSKETHPEEDPEKKLVAST